ncbi:hypothetical protein SS50377_23107 [Spironucleus salmonicida]|uniref:Uncharacterized protein n=1 Tax=Spironucleus salmonicida TaxID=348837 RepID=V6LBX6_9EUKA|nr:hypothetical protein SS50377_23107 [Spironucleus salmonicida]|eukprot:EST41718.1 Hypothetical protein SS50377_18804 [Spironucleus salmonicida]
MVLQIDQIAPYLFAELLTINHLMQFGEVVSPQKFAQIGISVIENDSFGQFFLGFLQRQHCEKVIEKNTTLESLYSNIILYCKYFIQAVEIDDLYDKYIYKVFEEPQNDQVRKTNVGDYIEELFWTCGGLTMNSIRFFALQIKGKLNIVNEMSEKRQGLIELRNIDIFEDQYMEIKKYSKKQVQRYEDNVVENPLHQQLNDLYETETDVLKRIL